MEPQMGNPDGFGMQTVFEAIQLMEQETGRVLCWRDFGPPDECYPRADSIGGTPYTFYFIDCIDRVLHGEKPASEETSSASK